MTKYGDKPKPKRPKSATLPPPLRNRKRKKIEDIKIDASIFYREERKKREQENELIRSFLLLLFLEGL